LCQVDKSNLTLFKNLKVEPGPFLASFPRIKISCVFFTNFSILKAIVACKLGNVSEGLKQINEIFSIENNRFTNEGLIFPDTLKSVERAIQKLDNGKEKQTFVRRLGEISETLQAESRISNIGLKELASQSSFFKSISRETTASAEQPASAETGSSSSAKSSTSSAKSSSSVKSSSSLKSSTSPAAMTTTTPPPITTVASPSTTNPSKPEKVNPFAAKLNQLFSQRRYKDVIFEFVKNEQEPVEAKSVNQFSKSLLNVVSGQIKTKCRLFVRFMVFYVI
jgi:hypothetical protein